MPREFPARRNEVVVVTGAAAGVGSAAAAEFGRQGASVALIARDATLLEQAAQEIRSLGGQSLVIAADVADSTQVQNAAIEVEQRLGPIDIWVNNAMVTIFSEFSEISAEELRRATEVTYLGTVWGTMAAIKCMAPRKRDASCKLVPRWLTGRFHCNRLIVEQR